MNSQGPSPLNGAIADLEVTETPTYRYLLSPLPLQVEIQTKVPLPEQRS